LKADGSKLAVFLRTCFGLVSGRRTEPGIETLCSRAREAGLAREGLDLQRPWMGAGGHACGSDGSAAKSGRGKKKNW